MSPRAVVRGQAAIGTTLAGLVIGAWLSLHVHGVFFHRFDAIGVATAPLLVAAQCWLFVGLFIVAHDGMHGSLAPGRPGLNRWIGRLALALYAGFVYDRLIGKHLAHHRNPGGPDDPDFHEQPTSRFWPWYAAFTRQYLGWRELAALAAISFVHVAVLGARPENLLLFWALPSILSSAQLFYFGTYLPHRRTRHPFVDRHNARSSDYSNLASLLSCFHFGYHHEHHLHPHLPWWRLPGARSARS